MSSEKKIRKKWESLRIADKFGEYFGESVSLVDKQIECIKKSKRSSIWKLELKGRNQSYPIILKIYTSADKHKNQVELNMYRNAYHILRYFMPQIYFILPKVNDKEIWVFMQYTKQLPDQIKMAPYRFDYIIPTIAKLHAQTFEQRFWQHKDVFLPWLPLYDSKEMIKKRNKYIEKTKAYLDAAMQRPHLKLIVEPSYSLVQKILNKGPDFFPELIEAGQSIIHNDLHVYNICCNNVSENNDWHIQLIDWESAEFAPCWFDMAILVEILMDFREDWHKDAEEIRRRCVYLYTSEMQKHGVTFKTDPLQLFKKAYLQRTLEKGIYTHLRRELDGRRGVLLPRYLEKVTVWGKELGLY